MKQKNNNSKSQKFQIDGVKTTAQLRALLNEAVDNLELRGIQEVTNSNLYVSPVMKNENKNYDVVFLDKPYECAADKIDL